MDTAKRLRISASAFVRLKTGIHITLGAGGNGDLDKIKLSQLKVGISGTNTNVYQDYPPLPILPASPRRRRKKTGDEEGSKSKKRPKMDNKANQSTKRKLPKGKAVKRGRTKAITKSRQGETHPRRSIGRKMPPLRSLQ